MTNGTSTIADNASNVSKVNAYLGDGVLIIVIIILAIQTIRSLIIAFGMFKDWKYSKIIYGNLHNDIAKMASEHTIKQIRADSKFYKNNAIITPLVRDESLPIDTSKSVIMAFHLLAEHIHKFTHDIVYGRQTPTKSLYYINTMEASHNYNKLEIMSTILYVKYASIYSQVDIIDFVITPKMGNTLLGRKFAEKCNAVFIAAKAENDHSRVANANGQNDIIASNFEGYSSLKARKKEEQQLRGAIVDCNCSGGSSLIKTARSFNKFISDNNLENEIRRISDVYVIFRADNDISSDEIEAIFEKENLRIHRLFDLDEELKKKLFQLSKEKNRHSTSETKTTKSMLKYALEHKLLR